VEVPRTTPRKKITKKNIPMANVTMAEFQKNIQTNVITKDRVILVPNSEVAEFKYASNAQLLTISQAMSLGIDNIFRRNEKIRDGVTYTSYSLTQNGFEEIIQAFRTLAE